MFHLEFPIKSGRRTSLGIGMISLRRRNLALGIDPGTENEVLIHHFLSIKYWENGCFLQVDLG